MKVFISSVRRGLEAERDGLTGLIMALGHEPRRFEDFGAQSTPSREACLRGVDDSDVYLLLLGPHYGHVFPETGQSATHDEWVAAVARGMHRLVFRKSGVDLEPEQEEFVKLVGDYAHGVFYAEFTDVADLQTKVVQALRVLESQPSTLTFSPLQATVEVRWREDPARARGVLGSEPWLELHVVPIRGERRSARQLRELAGQLVTSLRTAGALSPTAGAEPVVEDKAVVVGLPQPARRWNEPHDGALMEVRVDASGQVSLCWSLPGDGLGRILDQDALMATVARGLRLIGALSLPLAPDSAIAIGVGGGLGLVSEGKVTGVARSSATMSHTGSHEVRVVSDEAVSVAAFDRGADEVAQSIVLTLLETLRSAR